MLEKKHFAFLEDPKFIEWVFYPTSELNKYWSDFQKDNQDKKQSLSESVKLLKSLATKDKKLSAEEKHEILVKALGKYKRKKKSHSILINLTKYAAVAIVFFSLGYYLFNHNNSFHQQLISETISLPIEHFDGKIILSDGKNIPIKSKESSVNFTDNNVVLNQDTIAAKTPDNNNAITQVILPYGKQSFLSLPDGTEVWLNSGSRLLFPNKFSSNKREVFLVGEAYFKVKKNETKPFIVLTNELSVEALGTEFNISSYIDDNVVNTVLTEGSVRIQRSNRGLFDKDIYLEPNQIASFNKETQESSIKSINTANHISWKDGFFLFEGEDLNRVTKKLERYYNIKIRYDNPLTGSIDIYGKLLLNNDHQIVIDNIAATTSVTIQKLNETTYIIK